ncbi:aldo/keto reductase [Paenibacillus sp. NPDC056579]|uniref:aldo/keto reductase n=1 Tax=Paenibacillus sp. NPDC056579 TaxID=3345871 RepID=UPI0036938D86
MKYRKFGKTDWSVSEIGFGSMMLRTNTVEERRESVNTLLAAFESGINFVDTASVYASGRSEETVGAALKQWRGEPVYVATKVAPKEWPHPGEDDPDFKGRYAASYIREQCESSLRRLRIPCIDLYQLHGWFPSGLKEEEWFETLTDLQREGKIREFGVSLRDYRPDDGIALVRSGRTASVQVVYNLFEQRPAERLFPACAESDTGILSRVPFDEGALTGTWTQETYEQFPADDFRRHYFKGNRFAATLKRVEDIRSIVREVTGEEHLNVAETALRFCLSDPHVASVLVGMDREEHVKANVESVNLGKLDAELLARLQAVNWPRNYFNPDLEVDPT